jgi:hypothetical protein
VKCDTPPARVFDLRFTRSYCDRADTELGIGIYETRAEAQAAIESLRLKPGFCEHPEGFAINQSNLGQTDWKFGFFTTFGGPPKDAQIHATDYRAFR